MPYADSVPSGNVLYYGDNLDVLHRYVKDESVDLVYLDPPFNSNASYNVLFKTHSGEQASAQIHAFDDTWEWSHQADNTYSELTTGATPVHVAKFMVAMMAVLGRTDLMAYLVMMTPRLIELRRVLKPTGSIYLHCDPTASHYLKMLMDAVFGADNFLNEVIWCYGLGGSSARYWPRKHDDILWYSQQPDGQYFVADMIPATSNRMAGELKKALDYWEIPTINNMAKERLGYPTQKPLALLERIVRSSCPEGGIVLDPFCGCGTTIDAAQELKRGWIGIDITYIAIDLIIKRLRHRYGPDIRSTFTTNGIPEDIQGAEALFARNPFDFERWAISLVGGEPNQKQVGDQGIDGRIRFDAGAGKVGVAAVSVKGGQQINPSMVQSLVGAMQQEHADMAVLITMREPTPGMKQAAALSGIYRHDISSNTYPKVQIVTVAELLKGQRLKIPTVFLPYIKATARPASEAQSLW
jgi:site-specific DNA-methyltransferase (adenine-specific)